nr:HlyD family secretion protein [Elizabethkingia bruuniana]
MFKNAIYLSIIFFIIVVLSLLPVITIPISSSSRGSLRPIEENTNLGAVVSGRVIKTSLLKNNQLIKQGDTLLIVTAEQLDTQKQLQNTQSTDYTAQLNDLNKLTKGQYSGLQTGQYQRELSAMQEKIAQIQTELSLALKDLDRATILFKQGVVPKAEYDKNYYTHQGLVNQISNVREQQLAQWQAQKRETERQLRSLGSEIQKISQEQKNYVITAPLSGRLVNFSGIQKGNF